MEFESLQDGIDLAIRNALHQLGCCASKWVLVAETVVVADSSGQGLWCVASKNAKPWDTYGMLTCQDSWLPTEGVASEIQNVFRDQERSLTTKMIVVVEVIRDGLRELRSDATRDMRPWDVAGLLRFALEEEAAHHNMHRE